ncbi:hypothetical protein [Candidatus Poriferisocius sp.]|uniref:hypothetical protein n=1 Tax=Candidatus Poriferisocius sp. TaxID=3101276 RepID=UPI003B02E496
MTLLSLPGKIIAMDRALRTIPHAFGGAIALGYHAEPRATIDIDVNVFVPVERAVEVLDLLSPLGAGTPAAVEAVTRDSQTRIMWDNTPIDLFFSYDPFHSAADRAAIIVPFADQTIRVLSATHLCVCKAVFDRPKDWIDIEAMVAHRTYIDAAEALRWTGRITSDEDPRFNRLAALLSNP